MVDRRRGQALVEFALIALVFYLLLAVTIEFGRCIFSAQVLQDSSRVLAREVALTPFAATTPDLQTALDDSPAVDPVGAFKGRVYDEKWLFIDLDTQVPSGDVDTFFLTGNGGAPLPLVNQMLRPLMIYERVTDFGGNTVNSLHYPGAVVNKLVGGVTIQTVLIPQVVENPAVAPHKLNAFEDDPLSTTVPSIEWLPVVQEVAAPGASPFSVSGGGLVALRVNYPFQSAAMSGFHVLPPPPGTPQGPDISSPVISNDAAFEASAAPFPPGVTGYYKNASMDGTPGPYSGRAGLGNQLSFTMTTRPFRKVISAQAVFRREIFR